MKTIVKKWGNSASVRIPAAIMASAGLKLDQPVDIREDCGRVIIEAATSPDYDLDDLLAGITAENIHDPIDFGPMAGQESL
jgi:antitoxin MazE